MYMISAALKPSRKDAVFDSAGRLFHVLAPRYEKHFCPFADFFTGNLKSVSVFRRLWEEHAEFFVKRLHRYCGAKLLSELILYHVRLQSCYHLSVLSLVQGKLCSFPSNLCDIKCVEITGGGGFSHSKGTRDVPPTRVYFFGLLV